MNNKLGKDDEAIIGQGNATLTKVQIRDLILSAQTAYHVQQHAGLADEPFDIWRKAALHDVVGKASFRLVTQREYGRCIAYFVKLAGKKPTTRRVATKSGAADECSRARWAFDDECHRQAETFGSYEGARAYAESLLARIHRTTPSTATAKQLWQVVFTLRNRARAKLRQNAF